MANTNGGSSTFFKYDAVNTICDDMLNVINQMSTELDGIKAIMNNKDNIWKGTAASTFWNYLYNGKDEATFERVDTILKTDFPNSINGVKELVALNQQLDNKLNNSNNITANNSNDNIQGNSVTTGAYGVNEELNNSVGANDNIQGNATTTGAYGVNTELNNSVGASGNIHGNSTTTNATGIDTNLINDVKIENTIQTKDTKTDADSLNDALFESVGIKKINNENK